MRLFSWNKKKKEDQFIPSDRSKWETEFPPFLKQFETEFRLQERPCIRINAMVLDMHPLDDSLGIMESKFLGKPFFPKSKDYPIDKAENPMILAAQINFSDVPNLAGFPTTGILQLFLSPSNWDMEETEVIYHKESELLKPYIEDFSFIDPKLYDELPIWKLHSLGFESKVDRGGTEDSQFSFLINGLDYWDFAETLSGEQAERMNQYFSATGHKLGGYAEFTQSDPRDYSADLRNDIQLLQIDTDEHIMFGDSGIAHLFISPENLRKRNFEKSYFYWDCC